MSVKGGLRVGGKYRNRDGQIVLIAFRVPDEATGFEEDHPFVGYNQISREWDSYTESGYQDRYCPNDKDLVHEV